MHEIGVFDEALKLQLGWNGCSGICVLFDVTVLLKGGTQKQ